ncbi:MAG: folate-binding protein [Hyphomicrobiales bacterium]
MPKTILSDRAVLSLTGEDRITLLQGLVTVDLDRLETSPNVFGALLAPQGKIQFDFFLHKRDHAILIDMDASRAADFLKRMKMYKLRAKADIADVSDQYDIAVSWGDDASSGDYDARSEVLGARQVLEGSAEQNASPDEYHAHRIALGIPEAGKDFAFDDVFPHDAMMDALRGVDFKKGCYVGQEVVSRVQHRSTARKRFFILKSATPLKSDETVMLGDKAVGTTGTTFGNSTLALLRADKLEGATDPLTVDGQSTEAFVPSYFTEFQNKNT